MRPSPPQYARALLAAWQKTPTEARSKLVRRFLFLVSAKGDRKRLPRILREIERRYFASAGLRNVRIETASPLSRETRSNVRAAIGAKNVIREVVHPELLAGIRIMIDDNLLIDASAATQIHRLFSQRRAPA